MYNCTVIFITSAVCLHVHVYMYSQGLIQLTCNFMQDGRRYHHCDTCRTCVKPGRSTEIIMRLLLHLESSIGRVHCSICQKCDLPQHSCSSKYVTLVLTVMYVLVLLPSLNFFTAKRQHQWLGAIFVARWITKGGIVQRRLLHLLPKEG